MKRSEINEKYKWKIEDIYQTDKDFYADLKVVESDISFDEFRNKLNDEAVLFSCYKKLYNLLAVLEKLSVYAMMKRDENGADSKAMELGDAVDSVYLKLSLNTAFITPELSSLSVDRLTELKNSKLLKDYDRDIDSIIKNKAHVLSEECESLLASTSKVLGGYNEIFGIINNVDLKFPTIKVDGKKVKLTHANYSLLLQSTDRNVRKKAFKAYYKAFNDVLNTITAVYRGNLYKDVFVKKARKFDSCLDKALFYEEVDKSVYEKLLSCVNDNLPVLHDYVKFRKDYLGYDNLYMYDIYAPMFEGVELALEFEDAYNLVKEGLKPLGSDYISILDKALTERWIDVYETDGKRSGAYSVSVYNIKHPYVLLNHNKTTHSIFTIAHEMGHAIHSYKSNASQPQSKADYKIFVAEVASTVNEILLIKYLINKETDVKTKRYLLSYYLDTIRTTLFRQTMFAEFEYKAHNLAENDKPLTKEEFNKIYLKLNKKYYGKSIISNKEIAYEWARIPHFYRAFYVYKYATGIISAINIAENILKNGDIAVENYFKFLSSGSTDTPVELLKIAGVDLTTDAPYEVAMQSFASALNELKNLQ